MQSQQAVETLRIRAERLKQLAVSDTGFIFDPVTGQSFTVNSTGRLVIEMLKNEGTAQEAASALSKRYNRPTEMTASCVEAFIMQLGRYL